MRGFRPNHLYCYGAENSDPEDVQALYLLNLSFFEHGKDPVFFIILFFSLYRVQTERTYKYGKNNIIDNHVNNANN